MKKKWHAILIILKESQSAYTNVKVDLSPKNIVSGKESYFIMTKKSIH